jgi:hypothetical protein
MGKPLPTDDNDDNQDTFFAPQDENEGSFIDERDIHPENWAMWSEDSDKSSESGGNDEITSDGDEGGTSNARPVKKSKK